MITDSVTNKLFNETMLTLAAAAKLFPSRAGGCVNPSSVWRWTEKGLKTRVGRVRLERVKVGGQYFTTQEAVARFIEALNEPPMAETLTPRSPAKRKRASDRADEELQTSGW
jgi:hypothetical protein